MRERERERERERCASCHLHAQSILSGPFQPAFRASLIQRHILIPSQLNLKPTPIPSDCLSSYHIISHPTFMSTNASLLPYLIPKFPPTSQPTFHRHIPHISSHIPFNVSSKISLPYLKHSLNLPSPIFINQFFPDLISFSHIRFHLY